MDRFYGRVGEELTIWVRQIAWLNTAPEADQKGKGQKPEPVTRLEKIRTDGGSPLLPPNPAPYLTDWLFDVGPSRSGGMGEGPIGYTDLAAWENIIGVELMPWEARLLVRLSSEYLSERYKARNPLCPPPYTGDREQMAVERSRVENQFAAMATLKRKSKALTKGE